MDFKKLLTIKGHILKEVTKNKTVKAVRANKLAMWTIVIPFVAFTAYTLIIAKPRYVSNSGIVVQNISGGGEFGGVQALLMAGMQGASVGDLMLVKEYMNSPDMLNELDTKFHILDHWNSPWFDVVYKLWYNNYKELSMDYFKGKVKPVFNVESGVLQVSVETFDPKLSKEVLDFVIKKSEDFVNYNNHKGAQEQVKFIEGKLVEVKEKLDDSRAKVIEFQKVRKLFTPEAETNVAGRKILMLEESKVRAEAEFNAKKTFIQETAPQMVTLAETIRFLDKQITDERNKVIGGGKKDINGKALNDYVDEYKMLEGELNLHIEAYKNALITYEKVKIDAARKLKQIIMVASPQVPDYPTYPNKKLEILLAFICLNLIFGLLTLLKNIVKEHK